VALHTYDAACPENRYAHRRRPKSGELLRRLSHPFWFQAFGCGALKEGLRGIEHELGVYSQGSKGATSRKTPAEIRERCERLAIDSGPLIYASRMAAKVDSAAVQDGYQLYHHAFFFSGAGHWCVVQQGLSDQTRTARRYHWALGVGDEPCRTEQRQR